MQKLKNRIKKVLKVDYTTYLNQLKDLQYLGSRFAGYFLPKHILNEKSICYCVGAGVDVTFDTELVVNYNAKVFILDPAPEAYEYFNALKESTRKNEKVTVGKAPTVFTYRADSQQLDGMKFMQTGLWDKTSVLKFYKPTVENYPSHSIDLFNDSTEFIEAPVDRLSNIMKSQNHQSIDLLKIEIEGAEYVVIQTIVEDKPDIKMILVEFDEVYHPKNNRYLFRIKKSTESLINAGYVLAHSTPYFKRLFIRKDIFDLLKLKEK